MPDSGAARANAQEGETVTMSNLNQAMTSELRGLLRGTLLAPSDGGYDTARRVYNGMIDRHPGAIARCEDVADVMAAVRFAQSHDLLLSIRGGGHNAGGLGVCDDGLVIDLGNLRGIRVDPEARTVRVEGGCVWSQVDHATHAFGMATPSGFIGSTGVAGLTLGGGSGHLTRACGLTIDNLLEADVVLADGRLVHASEDHEPDLFWALRGGGGNFGVVTSFQFRLHPVANVIAGPTFWPLERGREVMQWYREFILDAPEELNGFFALMTVPPVPPFPAALHGQKVAAVVWCWIGPAGRADEVFAPVKAQRPALFGVQEMPFPMLQTAFDGLYPPGLQWYWRADFVDEIPDAAIARHLEFAARLPTPHSTMHMYPIDGAAHRVDRHATAFAHRDANWSQVIVGVDPSPANRDRIIRWTKDYWDAVHPYGAGGGYVNFLMGDEGQDRLRGTYRDNYARLAQVKRRYDPDNLFRVNQNIPPAPAGDQAAAPPPV
jgi:FAD/FMN-containing dehydrogenase